ncbi:MAG: hypothetical protein WD069_20650 [Planctomycetales bacterium]
MQPSIQQKPAEFLDRRQADPAQRPDGPERRQFRDARQDSPPEVRELAEAVDQYKLLHRRRFITFDELYDVIRTLGYHR